MVEQYRKELVEACKKQTDCDDDEYFFEILDGVRRGGADAGFNGFIYYHETIRFAEENMANIKTALRELARELGKDDIFKLIVGFGCLKNESISSGEIAEIIFGTEEGKNSDYYTAVMNALAWFVLEEVANWFEWDKELKEMYQCVETCDD